MKFTTTHYASVYKPEEKVTRYIKEVEIDGSVIETLAMPSIPLTNRGLPKAEGWLGSWSSGGCTKDSFSRGLCELVETKSINDDNGRIVMIEATWEPVKKEAAK